MNNNLDYKEIASMNTEEVMALFKTNRDGLNEKEVSNRLLEYGKNIATNIKKKTPLYFIIEAFKDKFVLILILLAVIDFITNDRLGACIIIGITQI